MTTLTKLWSIYEKIMTQFSFIHMSSNHDQAEETIKPVFCYVEQRLVKIQRRASGDDLEDIQLALEVIGQFKKKQLYDYYGTGDRKLASGTGKTTSCLVA